MSEEAHPISKTKSNGSVDLNHCAKLRLPPYPPPPATHASNVSPFSSPTCWGLSPLPKQVTKVYKGLLTFSLPEWMVKTSPNGFCFPLKWSSPKSKNMCIYIYIYRIRGPGTQAPTSLADGAPVFRVLVLGEGPSAHGTHRAGAGKALRRPVLTSDGREPPPRFSWPESIQE